jgi:hypothetical protein
VNRQEGWLGKTNGVFSLDSGVLPYSQRYEDNMMKILKEKNVFSAYSITMASMKEMKTAVWECMYNVLNYDFRCQWESIRHGYGRVEIHLEEAIEKAQKEMPEFDGYISQLGGDEDDSYVEGIFDSWVEDVARAIPFLDLEVHTNDYAEFLLCLPDLPNSPFR